MLLRTALLRCFLRYPRSLYLPPPPPPHQPTNNHPTQSIHPPAHPPIHPPRKYGHNEIDEPMFTQPLMYQKIRGHKNAHQRYVERLLAEGSLDAAAVGAGWGVGGCGRGEVVRLRAFNTNSNDSLKPHPPLTLASEIASHPGALHPRQHPGQAERRL
jgi:hypothetical protein